MNGRERNDVQRTQGGEDDFEIVKRSTDTPVYRRKAPPEPPTEPYEPESEEPSGGDPKGDEERPRQSIKGRMLLLVVLSLLLCGSIYLLASLIAENMQLEIIEINGEHPYKTEDILDAAELYEGQRLASISERAVEERISDKLTYVREVKVSVGFPNKITIDIVPGYAVMYSEIYGEYYALSAELRILEKSDTQSRFKADGLLPTSLPTAGRAVVGDYLTLGDDVSADFITEFFDTVEGSKFKGRINAAFLDEKYNIVFTADGSYRILCGAVTDLEAKLQVAAGIIDEMRGSGKLYAEIDVSSPKLPSAYPKESIMPYQKVG